ncbi:MAG: hypothetical protein K2P64_01705 [Lachnospiraceae bacterium]|nr:hypothetical protein [Lachnospiraceae bacterium]
MINRKNILCIAVIFGTALCMGLVTKWYNSYTVDEDIAPLVFVDWDDDKLQFYYLQNQELIEKPVAIDMYSNYTRYEINKEKREEILLQLWDGVGIPVKYNYKTDQMEDLGDNKELKEIVSLYIKEQNEYRFIPDSNNISFTLYDRIYVYEYEQKRYKEVYQFNYDNYGKLGFSYEWKNDKEIYLIKEGNFILYNIETESEEIILKNIGKVYFQMSDDGRYITYQKQWENTERRKLYLVDLHTMERKEIHAIKTTFLVETEFSPDSKYIFIEDTHRDTHLGKRYFYLYDIEKEKKYRMDIDDLPLGAFVGWGKQGDLEDAEIDFYLR